MKTKRIDGVQSDHDVSISVLHFLSVHSSPAIEIKKLEAGRTISVEIDRFIHRSSDYQRLFSKLQETQVPVDPSLPVSPSSPFLDDLLRLENHFRRDVLELANVFLTLTVTSRRLTEARTLFEQGAFQAASDLLNPNELQLDQDQLFIIADYWENRKRDSRPAY